MNGTSGFQEMWSSNSRSSTNLLLREQHHQFGADVWYHLRPHDLTALSIDITLRRKLVVTHFPPLSPEPNIQSGLRQENRQSLNLRSQWIRQRQHSEGRPNIFQCEEIKNTP